ncbi:P-loop containing nucleoside triphosphate hydrolase protein [Dioscorea alata]|uniref:P-loop containing nucleoside triphosphate hydrolase protein n=1 Tax=Dioscorea alata TaxID=55571 RepID=A0ACB7WL01_DIOAL|nr:P-loop containing nucleoside triphosphate hydrolase protein [Dioscorea alata]
MVTASTHDQSTPFLIFCLAIEAITKRFPHQINTKKAHLHLLQLVSDQERESVCVREREREMAEFVVTTVATKLSQMVTQELILLHGVNDELEWMERELGWIKCFLKDADVKGKRDQRVKNWVNDVTELAYRAEAAIDSFLIKVRPWKVGPTWINSFNPMALIARHHVGVEIREIKKRLNEIKVARETYGIQNLGDDGDTSNSISIIIRRRHFSLQYSHDADIVGLVNDQKILLERLLMNQQQQGFCVISIVGIGGLGKTTLARKLYRNNAVSNHFHKCIWLTVSQENSLMGLLRKMLEEVKVIKKEELEKLEKMTENDLIEMINDSLRAQRILIVLDDIWQEDVCIQMQGIFRNVNNGSRVLITTRFHNVAKRADPRSAPYQLQVLNDDESMKLLLKKAFLYEDADQVNCSSELLDIGRRLMRKCGGLPLALIVLGGFLSIRDKTPVVWRRVLETMDWEAEGRECQEILALSYEDLPHQMKLCFLYLGAYLEDSEIPGKELIRKWIAEGFIPQEGRKTMEDTAEAILEELIQRSLIHANTRKSNGSVKTCGIHDLLLDFARSTAKKDRFLRVCSNQNDQPFPSTMCHRVAIHIINEPLNNGINTTHNKLRTLMAFTPSGSEKWVNPPIISALLRFQFLRVLDLAGIGIKKAIPTEFKLMIHLRYLRLILFIHGFMFPASIGDLQLLETIDIKNVRMPSTLWNIKTLRHVKCPTCIPPQSLRLENLLTLDCVTFGPYETISWSFPNLRKLKVSIEEEHHGAMLNHLLSELRQLISLHIEALESHIEINTTKDFPFHDRLLSLSLEGLWPKGDDAISELPIYLTKIQLRGCRLKEDPMPKLGMLQHLVTLKLIENVYLGETMVCSAGGFPRLESLFILFDDPKQMLLAHQEAMPNLEEWRIERGAMPKLTFLYFTSCKKLKMLPDLQHVISLQTLKLRCMSEELMLRSEEERGEDWHKIQHVPKRSLETW